MKYQFAFEKGLCLFTVFVWITIKKKKKLVLNELSCLVLVTSLAGGGEQAHINVRLVDVSQMTPYTIALHFNRWHLWII